MQQLTFPEHGRLEWIDVPAPPLTSDDGALVRPLAVTTCDLDHAIVSGRVPLPGPFPLGHEFVAQVVDVGDAVTGVRPGDRVVVRSRSAAAAADDAGRAARAGARTHPSAPAPASVRSAVSNGAARSATWCRCPSRTRCCSRCPPASRRRRSQAREQQPVRRLAHGRTVSRGGARGRRAHHGRRCGPASACMRSPSPEPSARVAWSIGTSIRHEGRSPNDFGAAVEIGPPSPASRRISHHG